MRTLSLTATASIFVFVACGTQPTQFSSSDSFRVAFSVTGSGTDRVKQIKEQIERGEGDSVVLETGLSEAEQAEADAELAKSIEDAVAASGQSDGSGSSGSGTSAGGGSGSTDSGSGASGGSTSSGSGGSTGGGTTGGTTGGTGGTSGGSESATPFQFKLENIRSLGAVAGNLQKFKQTCASVMEVDVTKVIGPLVSGTVARDEVLLVYIDRGGALNIPLQGDSMRGICIMSGQGSTVSIEGNNTKVSGILSYQGGSGNKTSVTFSGNGKLEAAVTSFSGKQNSVILTSAKLASCSEPIVRKVGAGTTTCQ